MFNFSNVIALFTCTLTLLLSGCGYTVPDYIDALRFRGIATFAEIAKQKSLFQLPVTSISSIAFNERYLVYFCSEQDAIQKICVLDLKNNAGHKQAVRKIITPISSKTEATLLIDQLNQLYIVTREPFSKKIHKPNETEQDIEVEGIQNHAYQANINHPKWTNIAITQGETIKLALLKTLENKHIYQKIADAESNLSADTHIDLEQQSKFEQKLGEIDEKMSLKTVIQMTIYTFKGFFEIGEALVEAATEYQGHTLAQSVMNFRDLPKSYPEYFNKHLDAVLATPICIQPFSQDSFDYLIRFESHSTVWINIPQISDRIEHNVLKLCPYSNFITVNHQYNRHHVVTRNQASANHYVGGYTPEGFDVYEIKDLKFRSAFDGENEQLNILSFNGHILIQDPDAGFYLIE